VISLYDNPSAMSSTARACLNRAVASVRTVRLLMLYLIATGALSSTHAGVQRFHASHFGPHAKVHVPGDKPKHRAE
jgi:hypothetical protein